MTVDDALLTGFHRGPARSVAGPRRWMTGAVHDAEGRLVVASQRLWAGDPAAPVATDPTVVPVPADAPRLDGTWLYAGHWTNHFGHFLVETLTNLWPHVERRGLRGLVAHRSYRGDVGAGARRGGLKAARLSPWQAELLELAGLGGLGVQVVRGRPASVRRLVVPERPVVLKSWVRPEGVDVWRRMAAGIAPGSAERVFFSRSLFHQANTGDDRRVRVTPAWDAELDLTFDRAGFRVVHPETLALREQIALVKGARVIAGSQGSALHLTAFAEPGTSVLEIGDTRSPTHPSPAQRMIDAACGHRSAFVPHGDSEQLLGRIEDYGR